MWIDVTEELQAELYQDPRIAIAHRHEPPECPRQHAFTAKVFRDQDAIDFLLALTMPD